MAYIDLFIVVIIVIFAGKGFVKGFFVEALTLAGFFVALFIAANIYKPLGSWLGSVLPISPSLASVIVFIVLFVLITIAFGLAGNMLTKATKTLNVTGINRFFGLLFGAAKGAFVCGITLAVLMEKSVFPSLTAKIKASIFAPFLAKFANELLNVLNL